MVLPQPLSPLPPRVPEPGERWVPVFDLTAVVLGLAGFFGATYVTLAGAGQVLHFLGETATPEEVTESRRLFGLAAAIAAGVPLIGLLLALWARRRGVAIYLAVLLVVGASFAGLVALDAERNRPPEPVERGPHVCQELSGGDNRCPGG